MCSDRLIIPVRDIWENGIPLCDADYYFADEILRAKYNEPQIPLPFRILTNIVTLIAKPKDESQKLGYKKLKQLNQDLRERSDAYLSAALESQKLLLSDLRKGNLIGYGYFAPRNPTSIRVKIPRDLFESEYIKWEDSAIKGTDIEFSSVLVYELELAQEIDAQLAKKSPVQGTGIKRGPPSSGDSIEEAIRSLINDGTLPNHNQQKQNIGIVRSRVQKLHPGEFPNNWRLGNESIRKVLAKLIPRARN
jgi:hypothetical protein